MAPVGGPVGYFLIAIISSTAKVAAVVQININKGENMVKDICGVVLRIAVFACIVAGCFAVRPASADTFHCTPTEVGVFTKKVGGNRIHVRCSTAPAGTSFYWFAYGTSDAATAGRFLDVITFALQNSRTLTIWYDPAVDKKGTAIGCQESDCRLIQGMTAH